jgi:hypothetical protein
LKELHIQHILNEMLVQGRGSNVLSFEKQRNPVFMGTSVYAKTRKRLLVEMFHGLGIPYDRVLEVSAQLVDAVHYNFHSFPVVV